jgi:hypothetical protein
MIREVRMRIGIARSRSAVAAAVVVCGCSLLAVASGCQAAAFTDPAAFAAAATAAGIPINTDDFSTYPLRDISNGQTLGKFDYSFDPNLSDPTGTQPTIGLDGPNQVLTGAVRCVCRRQHGYADLHWRHPLGLRGDVYLRTG